jgi:ribose/xylose/arabinose/galactoside ABC-type transport system permease subunit
VVARLATGAGGGKGSPLRGALGRIGLYATELQLLLALAALYAIFTVARPSTFATWTNADNMARVGAILLVIAVGQAFALIVGGFDISVAVNMGFVSVVIALVATEHGGLGLAIPVGLAVGALIGLVNGFFIAALRVNAFVVTLAMATFLLGLGNQLSNGGSVGGLPDSYRYFGADDWGPIPSSLAIAAIVLALAWLVLARSRLGLYVYSIGGSRDTVRLAGAPVVRYEIVAYMICGLLAGVGGMIVGSRTTVGQTEVALGYELESIAAAVIGGAAIGGGVGRLSGVILGVALLTVLQNGMDLANVGEYYQRMITGLVLIFAVFISQLRAGSFRGVGRVLTRSRLRALLARGRFA